MQHQLQLARESRCSATSSAVAAVQRAHDGRSAHLLLLLWQAVVRGERGRAKLANKLAQTEECDSIKQSSAAHAHNTEAKALDASRLVTKENEPPRNSNSQEGDVVDKDSLPCGRDALGQGRAAALNALAVKPVAQPLLSSARTISTEWSKDSLQNSRRMVEVLVECNSQPVEVLVERSSQPSAHDTVSHTSAGTGIRRGPSPLRERLTRIPSAPRGLLAGTAPSSGAGTPVAGVGSAPGGAAATGTSFSGLGQLQRSLSSRSCSWTSAPRSDQSGPHWTPSARLEACDVSGEGAPGRLSSNSYKSSQGDSSRPGAIAAGRAPSTAPQPLTVLTSPRAEQRGASSARSPGLECRGPAGVPSAAGSHPPPGWTLAGARHPQSAGSSLTLSVGAESPLVPASASLREASPPVSSRGHRAAVVPAGALPHGLVVASPAAWSHGCPALLGPSPPAVQSCGSGLGLRGSMGSPPVALVQARAPLNTVTLRRA